MGRASTLPKRLQPMVATLTDGPFDDPGWIFEDKYDGFRMVAKIESGIDWRYSDLPGCDARRRALAVSLLSLRASQPARV